MREIKFRAMKDDISDSSFKYGMLVLNVLGGYAIQTTNSARTNTCHTVIENTIGQFTGLTDKNGKDVFEGDILKTRTLSEELNENAFSNYEVGFNGCSFCLIKNRLPVRQWKDGTHDWFTLENTESFEMEIIGNIHENPELI